MSTSTDIEFLPAPTWGAPPATPRADAQVIDVWRIARPSSTAGDAPAWHAHVQSTMRRVVSSYLSVDVDALQIARTATGKPHVAEPACSLQFNLSHCAELALLAVSDDVPVGVDVEGNRRVGDPLRLARRVFSRADMATLEQARGDELQAVFLALWTRFEARQKAFGNGIFGEAVAPGAASCKTFVPTAGFVACVCAAQSSPLTLRFFDDDAAAS